MIDETTKPEPEPEPEPELEIGSDAEAATARHTRLSRRGFLTIAGGAALGGAVAGRVAWGALVSQQIEQQADPALIDGPARSGPTGSVPSATANRVLVVVQMSGGNDGLNTLIPVADGRYFDARPTLRVKDTDVLRLKGIDRYGFHPSLAPLLPYWDRGQLAAVDAIGLPGQTRSHFAAMDAWWSAHPGEAMRSGWLGRWLDRTGDPDNPLRAIALGGGSPALLGERSISTMVRSPAAFTLKTPKGSSAAAIREAFLATSSPLASDEALAQAQKSVPAALRAVDLMAAAKGAGVNSAPGGPPNYVPQAKKGANAQSAAELLQTAAGVIELGLGTQIILVAVDGFDTHSDQARRHPELLSDVATGIAAFLDTMQQKGRADEVLLMTTSEFGRRVQENGGGTDHGNGGVQFLGGPMVKGGQVVGQSDLQQLDQGDLRATIDTRSLYANALDWLSGPSGPTDEVLGRGFDRYGLVVT